MKNFTPEVSVVIANYNGEKFLETCLSSLLASTYQNFEILITDDGSTDDSKKIIESFKLRTNKITLIENESNLGASASRNKAFNHAKGKYILFLDNDTEVSKDCLTNLVHTMKGDRIGACQALLLDFERRDKIQNAGVKLWAATGWGLPEYQWQNYNALKLDEEQVVAISAGLMIKKEVFEKVGGFDELESVVTEDLDFSWMIWLSGYKIVLSPRAIIYHMTKNVAERKNMNHNSSIIYFHLTKNSLMSILKNYQAKNAFKYFFYSAFISFSRSLLVLIRKKDTSSFIGTLKGYLWISTHLPSILIKRKKIQAFRKVSDNELFSTVILRQSLFTVYNKYFSQTNLV